MSSFVVLKNLIPDPLMLTNGWSGAVYDTAHALVGERSIKLAGTTGTPEVCMASSLGIPLVPSHIYYARMYGWQDTRTSASVGFYWPIAEPSFQEGIPIGSKGMWNLYSGRAVRSAFTSGSYQMRMDFNNGYLAGVMYLCGIMLVDLTAAFGVGLEPNQAWCDAYLPFFEDTITLTAAEEERIVGVTIAPNPVIQNTAYSLSVEVADGIIYAVPAWPNAGDYYSGEV